MAAGLMRRPKYPGADMRVRRVAVWVAWAARGEAERRRCHSEPSVTTGPANGENRSVGRTLNEMIVPFTGPIGVNDCSH